MRFQSIAKRWLLFSFPLTDITELRCGNPGSQHPFRATQLTPRSGGAMTGTGCVEKAIGLITKSTGPGSPKAGDAAPVP